MKNTSTVIAILLLLLVMTDRRGASVQQGSEQSVLNATIATPIKKGSVPEVIRALANEIRDKGLIGFQQVRNDTSNVAIDADASLGQALREIVQRSHQYRIATTNVSRVANLIGAYNDSDTKLLELRISKCDISVDDWPQNWFMRLPEFCPEVSERLRIRYKELGGRSFEAGGPGASMEGNIRRPHLELHVSGKSIREILNDLAVRSMTITSEPGTKVQPGSVVASGWSYSIPGVGDMTFYIWRGRIFSGL